MSAESDLRFLRSLQRLLDEGLFVSTYKFALLQALADLAVEWDHGPDGDLRLPVPAIAEKFIEYYWRQALPFRSPVGGDSAAILLQSTDEQAAIIRSVADARTRYDGMIAAARQDITRWAALRKKVAGVIRQMPLWKLQTIAREPNEFLYRQDEYRKADDTILLLPGVAAALRNFHGLITTLIRGAWVDQVQRIPANRVVLGDTASLTAFLFGSDRASLAAYKVVLRGHQKERCFFCGARVRGEGELDHFIAWSRYPVDLGHNFVFTDARCNRLKRDYLAHPVHLRHWREQNLDAGEALAAQFSDADLAHDAGRSRQIALWAYGQGEAGAAHVWLRHDDVQSWQRGWRDAITGRN